MSQSSYAGIVVERASGDRVYTSDGAEFVDLFCGAGTVMLGHCDPVVTDAVRRQLEAVWNTGALRSTAREAATEALARFAPPGMRPIAIYSTGMEAAELALRAARVYTGRPEFVGFSGAMHGKSMATAYLGWHNAGVEIPAFRRLPRLGRESEDALLERAAALLRSGNVAAVFVEPIHASAGGHMASPRFYAALAAACRDAGTLLVCDEIFTGCFRAGPAFLHQELGIEPDLVLLGKAMGNGFPVSAVLAREGIETTPAMLPASTFSGNPLAAAAVRATLSRLQALDVAALVRRVHDVMDVELSPLARAGAVVRGRGALWVVELPSAGHVERVATTLATQRVLVSTVGACLRVLPPAIIEIARLREACATVVDAIREALEAQPSAV